MNRKAAVHNTSSSSLHFRMYSRPLRVQPFKLSDIVPDAELLATLEADERLAAYAVAMIRFRVLTVPALAENLNFICLFDSAIFNGGAFLWWLDVAVHIVALRDLE